MNNITVLGDAAYGREVRPKTSGKCYGLAEALNKDNHKRDREKFAWLRWKQRWHSLRNKC